MSKPVRKKRLTKRANDAIESDERSINAVHSPELVEDINTAETALILSGMSSPIENDEMAAVVNSEFNQLLRKACANRSAAPAPELPIYSTSAIVHHVVPHAKAYDTFQDMCDEPISSETWLDSKAGLCDLAAITIPSPIFQAYIADQMDTHAALTIIVGPGLGHAPVANSYLGPWVVKLVPHALLPQTRFSEWKISSVDVIATVPINRSAVKLSPKEKKSGVDKKQKVSPTKMVKWHESFAFAKDGRAIIDSVKLPASVCQNVYLTFVCQVEWNGIACSFSVNTAPFQVISNCNQWPGAFAASLEHAIYDSRHELDASLARCYNHVQLGYLQTKSFSQHRFLTMQEIWLWMQEYCSATTTQEGIDSSLLAQDLNVAQTTGIISRRMFAHWIASAAKVFYGLHTSNFGKKFQSFWMSGFIGIGKKSLCPLASGTARLFINTTAEESDRNAVTPLSYLSYIDESGIFDLFELDRGHLDHFLYHSRHSIKAVRLEHALQPNTFHVL